jgi:hypothetical protein
VYESDKWYQVRDESDKTDKRVSTDAEGLVRRKGCRYVPELLRQEVLRDNHDLRHAGHPGRIHTLFNV